MIKPQDIAIPLFAVSIGLEALFVLRKRSDYDRVDLWANIGIGWVSAVFDIAFGLMFAWVYILCYDLSPLRMPENTWWSWVLLFFLDDLCFYWMHRVFHESRFFWNFHVVHHSSNRYNLSTAVRQSWFGNSVTWIFYIPLAFLGFPFWMRLTAHGFNLTYQFFLHFDWIPKLGILESFLNTPSHHRVHHAVNPQYIDKNYGGILIIFDRLFGSFAVEDEAPRYGIIKPIKTYNWITINIHAWREMWQELKLRPDFLGKLRCVFGSPNMELEK